MNFRQIELFVKIAETKNFTQAARELYISQPTVSTHVQSLEKEMDADLLVRTNKEVFLTAKGEVFYGYAKKMILLEQRLRQEFHLDEKEGKKNIAIAASTVPAQFIMPYILPEFRTEYPNITFSIFETDSAGVVEKLLSQEVEIGLTGTKIVSQKCIFEPFYKDELTLVLPNNKKYHDLLKKKPDFCELVKEPFVMREESSGTYMETETLLRKQEIKIEELTVAAHMNHPETLLKSVSLGLGISIISRMAAKIYIQEGKVIEYPLPEEMTYRNLYIARLKNHNISISAEKFIHYIKKISE